jgi:hypothetical protein
MSEVYLCGFVLLHVRYIWIRVLFRFVFVSCEM